MDRCLIDLLLDEVHKGNKIGQTFISQAWNDMVASFNAKFKSHYDRDVLKNRYKHLRRQYNDVKVLLEHNGFSSDETQEMVTAEDHVWDTYTTAHADTRSYIVKTVPSYHKLCVTYRQDTSDGKYSRLACNVDPDGEVPLLMIGDGKGDQFPAIVHPVMDWTPSMDRYDSIAKAIDALQAISDIDDELLLDGYDLLEDERKAKAFLALDVNHRKKWLLRKLGR
ncbi:L10-interacting MYB domain-containing protein [Camellia lanceoleosa]|uniref:L10-interacting MYB domain-containing protein n=1 Tax=Camellia lanceoleosa TaxID=1840588 RepID=A0ACC0I323_9ERIC|nr:L10-interacting MYB domain-containing protein [Camellia lanceoleosa]